MKNNLLIILVLLFSATQTLKSQNTDTVNCSIEAIETNSIWSKAVADFDHRIVPEACFSTIGKCV